MSFPKILLITTEPPNQRDGNRHQLKPILEKYASSIVWFSVKPPAARFEFLEPDFPYRYGYLLSRPSRPFLRPFREWLNFELWSRYLGTQAAQFGAKHDVSIVWTIAETFSMLVGNEAAKTLRAPLALSVMDDPVGLMVHASSRSSIKRVKQVFKSSLRQASSHSVISQAMADHYHREYGINPIVLYIGIDPEKALPQRRLDQSKSPIVIGSTGRIYPNLAPEWQTLIHAVHKLNSEYGKEKFKVLHVGDIHPSLDTSEVEVTGWLSGIEYEQALRRFDLSFSTLSFAEETKLIATTSFPTKISTYIQVQKPIITLAPPYSSITQFVTSYQCGITCTSLNEDILAEQIKCLVFQNGLYDTALEGMRLAKTVFTKESFFHSFENLINKAIQEST